MSWDAIRGAAPEPFKYPPAGARRQSSFEAPFAPPHETYPRDGRQDSPAHGARGHYTSAVHLSGIELTNFRSYRALDLTLGPGLTIVHGVNHQNLESSDHIVSCSSTWTWVMVMPSALMVKVLRNPSVSAPW